MVNALSEARRRIDLVDVFSKRMRRQQSPHGFYGWSGLKYFLFTQETGDRKLPWKMFEGVSLEHILPQSAVDEEKEGWWIRQILDYAPRIGDKATDEDYEAWKLRKQALVNSLGNFVLLTQAENASVSNLPWESYKAGKNHREVVGKCAFYSDAKRVSSAGARDVARIDGSWNAYRIHERGVKLFATIASMLKVSVSSEQIDKALGFTDSITLSNRQFGNLDEEVVSKLARKLERSKKSVKPICCSISHSLLQEVFGIEYTLLSDDRSFRT
ncbi:MAG: HNH endonuclease, partial [Kiritimatiellae bacterium]|nr:HNH endonuclease [Kiritimatiellia bacterium]